jgi:hypothetical protein
MIIPFKITRPWPRNPLRNGYSARNYIPAHGPEIHGKNVIPMEITVPAHGH